MAILRRTLLFAPLVVAVGSVAAAAESHSTESNLEEAKSKSSKYWIQGEYIAWSIKKNPLPVPLITTASYSDSLPGALGQPGTHTLLGRSSICMGWMNGFQVGLGASMSQKLSIEGSYFLLPTVSKSRSFKTSGQPGSPNFAVPVFDETGVLGLNGVAGESIFILPGPLDGQPGFFARFNLRVSSRFQGADVNTLYSTIKKEPYFLGCLGGVRWFELHESLVFKAKSGTVPNFPFEAGFFNFRDRLSCRNNFLGAELGVHSRYLAKRWRLEGILKGALGATLEQIEIRGSSRTSGGNLFFATEGTADTTLKGGIFAQPSNIGTHNRIRFAGALEVRACSGYQITRHIEMNLGYTFLWISKLLRPGNQIDRKINSTRTALAAASRATVGTGPGPIAFGTPGPAPAARGPKRPKVLFKSTSFWAQGFDVGVTAIF